MSAMHDSPPAAQVDADEGRFARLKPGRGGLPDEVAANQEMRLRRAMIEVVAANGYDTVKVREVVKVAGVSSKTFYRLFESKEDCFLRTHEAVVRSARAGFLSAQWEAEDWQERPRLIYTALVAAIEDNPESAHVAFVDAYSDGPAALEQARRAEATFAAMLEACLARAPEGVAVPPMVVEGMMAGVGRVARGRLRFGRGKELRGMEGALMEWAMCFPVGAAAGLAHLDLGVLIGNTSIASVRARAPESTGLPTGDRATILAALGKLVAADGYRYRDLTVPRVRAGAGVSRRTFDAHFDDVEACFLAALDQRAAEAVAQAARAQIAGSTWGGGVYRAINSFAIQIAGDPLLARVCYGSDFAVGSKGSNARLRLIGDVSQQLRDSTPDSNSVSDLSIEASAGGLWGIFHHHVLRDWVVHHPEVSATLAYMALAPTLGAAAAVEVIRDEQMAA